MARKEFRYRGLTLEQLQQLPIQEFIALLPSRERRSLKRKLTPEEQSFVRKIEKRDKVKTHQRQMVILPMMVEKTIMVYTGKEYVPVMITEEMIGHRLGAFALTRKRTAHTTAGVGVTKGGGKKG